MRINILTPIPFLFLCLFSCSAPKSELGLAEKYFPASHYLKDGIVNKYYLHFKSNDGYDFSTDIEYRQYLLTKSDELVVRTFNPAFEPTRSMTFQLTGNKMLATKDCSYFRGDSVFSEIIQPAYFDWENNPAIFLSKTAYESGMERSLKLEHRFLKDTIILNKPAKIFHLKQIKKDSTKDGSVKEDSLSFQKIYMEGIGLFSSEGEIGNGFMRREMIEQIPGDTFNKMANHLIKRVGYIDPEKKLGKNNDFKICGKTERIIDYYNTDPAAGFIGGKKALWSTILPKIDPNKMHSESGYMTFRFVINCNGVAGYFITEEAGLDFKNKKFNPDTVGHLFGIVSNLNNWRPSFLWGQSQDAYAYLTFKLKDGEIIEILP